MIIIILYDSFRLKIRIKSNSSLTNAIFLCLKATNRQFPQSMTGAYVSGIYTADKILQSLMAP